MNQNQKIYAIHQWNYNTKLNPPEGLIASIQNPVRVFIYNDEVIEITQKYLNHAPCALKDLTIRITGVLEYIDFDELDKKLHY